MTERVRFWLVVGLPYVALALAWSLVLPTWEAPDEEPHLQYARHVAREGRLPAQAVGAPGLLLEGHQPPLYYVLLALLVGKEEEPLEPNPAFPDEPAAFLHGPEETFPFAGVAAEVHWLRLTSVAMGVVAVLLIHRLARSLWPGDPARSLLAVGWCAFLPQFTYVTGSLNNGVMASVFSAWALYLLLAPRTGGTVSGAVVGLAVGCALLAKTTTLFLVPLGALILWFRHGIRTAAAYAVTVLVVSGWWFVRNAVLYGDPLAWKLQVSSAYALVRPERISLGFMRDVCVHLFRSYWGAFGDGARITLPPSLYCVLAVLCSAVVAGVVLRVMRKPYVAGVAAAAFLWTVAWPMARRWLWVWVEPGHCEIIGAGGAVACAVGVGWWLKGQPYRGRAAPAVRWALWGALGSLAGVLVYNLRFPQAQGRFLFPALACHGLLVALALGPWIGSARRTYVFLGGLASLNIVVLLLYVWCPFHGGCFP
jgi:hypothetical protein